MQLAVHLALPRAVCYQSRDLRTLFWIFIKCDYRYNTEVLINDEGLLDAVGVRGGPFTEVVRSLAVAS